MAISDYLSNALVNHVRGIALPTPPANVYVGLYTTATDDAGGGTEVTGNGYQRAQISTSGSFSAPSDGSTSNIAEIAFAPATGGTWGPISHIALHDASTGGNRLFHGQLVTSVTVEDGKALKFPSGKLTVAAGGALSDYLEAAVVNWAVRGIAFPSPPASLYLAVFTSATDDASGGTEVVGNGYARVQLSTTGTFTAPDGDGTFNLNDIMFPKATGTGWGVLTHYALHDAPTAGNRLYHAELTRTNTIGPGDRLTFEADTLRLMRTASTFVSDTFSRIVTDGWGAADSGGTWARVAGSAGDFDVDGQAAQITFSAAGAAREMVLNSVSQLDGQLLYRWAVEKAATGGYNELLATFRTQDVTGATWYGVNARRQTSGNVDLLYVRRVSNAQTLIAGPFTVSGITNTGQALFLKVEYEGTNPTTVRARCWEVGQNEPSTWIVNDSTDSTGPQTAGGVGFKGFLEATTTGLPYTYWIDSLLGESL